MAPELLNSTKLLGEFLRLDPHTLEGQQRAAEKIAQLVHDHALGTCRIFQFPVLDKNGVAQDHPLVVIDSAFGPSTDTGSITWLGHLDTVPLKGKQLTSDRLVMKNDDKEGHGRGTLDMWAGNIAYLHGLKLLKQRGAIRRRVQTVLTSDEEVGSRVLWQALQAKNVLEQTPIGMTVEVSTFEDGTTAPIYHGRTGRFGFDVAISGEDAHAGMADKNPDILEASGIRYLGRMLDESMDQDRHLAIDNAFPGDTHHVLPIRSRVLPNQIIAIPDGLSLPQADVHFNCFHSDPELAAESVRARLAEYLTGEYARIPAECLEVTLEKRDGVPFTEPWLTPADHPLVAVAHQSAKTLSNDANLPLGAASGVAEEGMLRNTHFVGWGPVGYGSHKANEWVLLSSIMERAHWLADVADFDGDLDS